MSKQSIYERLHEIWYKIIHGEYIVTDSEVMFALEDLLDEIETDIEENGEC